jgi:hypothetical protein
MFQQVQQHSRRLEIGGWGIGAPEDGTTGLHLLEVVDGWACTMRTSKSATRT